MAHETVDKGAHSELLAQTALIANGYTIAKPVTPEPADLWVTAPGDDATLIKIQVKTARRRLDREGQVVVYAKKNNGTTYTLSDCGFLIGILDNEVYMFPNREIGEYWTTEDKLMEKWTHLPINFNRKGEIA